MVAIRDEFVEGPNHSILLFNLTHSFENKKVGLYYYTPPKFAVARMTVTFYCRKTRFRLRKQYRNPNKSFDFFSFAYMMVIFGDTDPPPPNPRFISMEHTVKTFRFPLPVL